MIFNIFFSLKLDSRKRAFMIFFICFFIFWLLDFILQKILLLIVLFVLLVFGLVNHLFYDFLLSYHLSLRRFAFIIIVEIKFVNLNILCIQLILFLFQLFDLTSCSCWVKVWVSFAQRTFWQFDITKASSTCFQEFCFAILKAAKRRA